MAGRDAGRYHDVVAAGLRARQVHLYESAWVSLLGKHYYPGKPAESPNLAPRIGYLT